MNCVHPYAMPTLGMDSNLNSYRLGLRCDGCGWMKVKVRLFDRSDVKPLDKFTPIDLVAKLEKLRQGAGERANKRAESLRVEMLFRNSPVIRQFRKGKW